VTPDPRRKEISLPPLDGISPAMTWAIEAAQSKLASSVTLLDLRKVGTFTDAFLLCSGASLRQVQAIADAIQETLDRHGLHLWHREGYESGEWVLLDYGFGIVHIFHERARNFYDLERLWRQARRIDLPDVDGAGAPRE
jgi:ribosome-associated protein